MTLIDKIRHKIADSKYVLSKHAVDQSIIRDIKILEMEQALLNKCEVIEDYPDDKYGPSCLVLGITNTGRPLHFQVSYPEKPLLKIITLYEPDPQRWSNFRTRNLNS